MPMLEVVKGKKEENLVLMTRPDGNPCEVPAARVGDFLKRLRKIFKIRGSELPIAVAFFFIPSPRYKIDKANSKIFLSFISMLFIIFVASTLASFILFSFCNLCHKTAFFRAVIRAIFELWDNFFFCVGVSLTFLNQPLRVDLDIPYLFSIKVIEKPLLRRFIISFFNLNHFDFIYPLYHQRF